MFCFLGLVAFSQNNKYSIYVSFAEKRKAKKYNVYLLNNDSIYTIKPNEYYRFNYENNNLKLIIKSKKTNAIVLEMDSLEQFYILDNNTIYVYIGMNEKAKPTSIAGAFNYSDYSDDVFCIDCIENKNHLVVIECSKGEFAFKKRNRCFLKRLFDK